MDYKQIAKGLETLTAISNEEVDKTIAWLEEALAAYKTLRAVKNVVERKPAGLEIPEWESAVDMDRRLKQEDNKKRIIGNGGVGEAIKPKLVAAFQNSNATNSLTISELMELTKLSRDRVYTCLKNHEGKTFHKNELDQWELIVASISGIVA